jgi:hypothetical protein
MTTFKLSGRIQFKEVDKTQFPCNLEFESIPSASLDEFKTPGIFFLYYRGELIYIGLTNNNQDVIAERVVRQLATITLRDHRIQFTQAALDELHSSEISNTYFNLPEPVVANIDFVTSVNRVKYAAHHWDEFKNFNSETLSRFEMEWYPNPDLKGCNSIEELCQQLKDLYRPRCNQEYRRPKYKINE